MSNKDFNEVTAIADELGISKSEYVRLSALRRLAVRRAKS